MKLTKSYYLFFLLPLFLLSFTDGNKKKNDWEKEKLKGNVKSIREYYYNEADDKTLAIKPSAIGINDSNSCIITNYNEKGNVTTCNWHRGNLEGKKWINRYDDAGNLIESTTFNTDDSISKKSYFIYDANLNCIESNGTYYGKHGMNFKLIYKYDDKNNRIEMGYYKYFKDSQAYYQWIYKYDENDNNIEEYVYHEDGKLSQKYINKFDNDHNLIQIDAYSESLMWKYFSTYNENGLMTDEHQIGKDDKLMYDYAFKYEYDDKGNWIKKIKYEKDIPIGLTIRVIEYY